jgi:hypothetical protein
LGGASHGAKERSLGVTGRESVVLKAKAGDARQSEEQTHHGEQALDTPLELEHPDA